MHWHTHTNDNNNTEIIEFLVTHKINRRILDTLVKKTFCDVNVDDINLCMHNHFRIEIIFPNRDVV